MWRCGLFSSAAYAEIAAGEFILGKHTAVHANTSLHLRHLFTLVHSAKHTTHKAVLRVGKAAYANDFSLSLESSELSCCLTPASALARLNEHSDFKMLPLS
jgi:hypothetical protein